MSTTNDELVGRVLNAVPARTYEMGALLSVLRIEVTTEVPTASVSCERRPVLRINPEFVQACCRTDEHLFLLVMHELHHVLLGHTRLFPRPTPAHNLAFDAVINALLCRRFPARAYTSFFSQLYDDAQGAARLLAPPGSRRIGTPRLDALHDMLYRRSTVTAAEVFDAIVWTLPSLPEGLVWLGSHGNDADGFGEGDQAVAAALRPVVSKWPGAEAEGRGKGLEQAIEAFTKPRRDLPREVLVRLRRALTTAAARPRGQRRLTHASIAAQVPLPTMSDRRALVARSAGMTPLLYTSPLTARVKRPNGRTAVYLDVSGSMDEYLPLLYGALHELRALIQPDVHVFSTVVHTIRLADLGKGRCPTTGGTDIRCAVEHALQGRVRRLLVITDGMTGAPSGFQEADLRQQRFDVRVLLTPGGQRQYLAGIARRFDELPALDGRAS